MEGRNAFQIRVKDLSLFAFMGIIGIGCAMLFSLYSIELIDASLATLVAYAYPAMTMLMLLIFMGEKATLAKTASLLVTFLGLSLVVRIDQGGFLLVNGRGIIFGLVASFCFAIYNTLSEKAMKGVSPVKLITYCMVFLVSFFGFFFGSRPYPDIFEVWMIASLLGICTGFLPFLLYIYGVQRIGAGKAVIVSSLAPVFTLLWTYTFLGEHLDIVQLFGMGLIIFGVIILKLKAPVRLMIGTGEEIKNKLEGLSDDVSPDRRLFAFIYLTCLRKKR
jgi:drug/metabolite transporter (DMT)-like permease